MVLPKRKPVSYTDLLALPDHLVGEILDGELIASARPASRHAMASSTAGGDLSGAFHRKPGGSGGPGGWWIVDAPELHLGRHVLVPDLAGWRRDRMPVWPDVAYFELAPDWACEVVSPASVRRDRVQKSRIYLECGVQWLWLVDPAQRLVEVLRHAGEHWILQGAWVGDDVEARIPPFDAIAIDLTRWWPEEAATPAP